MGSSRMFGNSGIVMSALRNYVLNLHKHLQPYGIFVGHLSISTLIKKGRGIDRDQVADAWYNLYEQQDTVEDTFPKGITQFLN